MADGATALSEIVRNYAIVIGGVIGLAIAGWRGLSAGRQAGASLAQSTTQLSEHTSALFNQAVAQLADQSIVVRLGAIYTLKNIAENFVEYQRPVFHVLSAYLRTRPDSEDADEPGEDVQEIIDFLGLDLAQ